MSTSSEAAAGRLKALLESGDPNRIEEVYAKGAVIWHNNDGVELSRDQIAGVVGALGGVATCKVEVIEHIPIDGGFVQTQKSRYELKDGSSTEFHAALVVRVDEAGKITRLDEYLDGAGLAPLIAALG